MKRVIEKRSRRSDKLRDKSRFQYGLPQDGKKKKKESPSILEKVKRDFLSGWRGQGGGAALRGRLFWGNRLPTQRGYFNFSLGSTEPLSSLKGESSKKGLT